MTSLQTPSSQPEVRSLFRKPILYSSIAALCVTFYFAFVLLSRHASDRAIEKQNAAKAAEERRANDQAAIEGLGGSELAIRAFYASPPVIHPGETAQLCYDVANAKTVTLDPPAGEVWPSHSRCLALSPSKATTYTLTIADAKGQSTSQSVKLEVKEQAPIRIKQLPSR